MELPDWIEKEIWEDWLGMREEKKYPTTERQQRAALRTLKRAHEEGHDPNKMLDNAINAGWQGLFTGDNTGRKIRPASHGHGPKIEAVEINREAGRESLRMIRGALK